MFLQDEVTSEKGQDPVDFVFHEGKIYIACYHGGGIPYADENGSTIEQFCTDLNGIHQKHILFFLSRLIVIIGLGNYG